MEFFSFQIQSFVENEFLKPNPDVDLIQRRHKLSYSTLHQPIEKCFYTLQNYQKRNKPELYNLEKFSRLA